MLVVVKIIQMELAKEQACLWYWEISNKVKIRMKETGAHGTETPVMKLWMKKQTQVINIMKKLLRL